MCETEVENAVVVAESDGDGQWTISGTVGIARLYESDFEDVWDLFGGSEHVDNG